MNVYVWVCACVYVCVYVSNVRLEKADDKDKNDEESKSEIQ